MAAPAAKGRPRLPGASRRFPASCLQSRRLEPNGALALFGDEERAFAPVGSAALIAGCGAREGTRKIDDLHMHLALRSPNGGAQRTLGSGRRGSFAATPIGADRRDWKVAPKRSFTVGRSKRRSDRRAGDERLGRRSLVKPTRHRGQLSVPVDRWHQGMRCEPRGS